MCYFNFFRPQEPDQNVAPKHQMIQSMRKHQKHPQNKQQIQATAVLRTRVLLQAHRTPHRARRKQPKPRHRQKERNGNKTPKMKQTRMNSKRNAIDQKVHPRVSQPIVVQLSTMLITQNKNQNQRTHQHQSYPLNQSHRLKSSYQKKNRSHHPKPSYRIYRILKLIL